MKIIEASHLKTFFRYTNKKFKLFVLFPFKWTRFSIPHFLFNRESFKNLNLKSILQRTTRPSKIFNLIVFKFFLSPQGKILLEKLNNLFGFSELLFLNLNLIDNLDSISQSFFTKFTRLILVFRDLVCEYGVAEGQTEFDRVAIAKALRWLCCLLISF